MASSCQVAIDWGTGRTTTANEKEAESRLRDCYEKLAEKVGADQAVMCLSCPSSEGWRKQVLPTYKSNRASIAPPILREHLKQFTQENYKSYLKPSLEGDDCLGILMTHPKIIKGHKVCCSIDKDMKTIPGTHYHMAHGIRATITWQEADYWHMFQTLTGDTTDGYKGCPHIGKVFAERILSGKTGDEMWEAVVETYEKKGLTEHDALQQAQVARICRHTDYDYKEKKVKLWQPEMLSK